jgi:transcriptional regulator with XRE-family HTH domain
MSGDELKQRRESLGFTQGQLAEALGVDIMTVSRWERGARSIPEYLSLALETIERNHAKNKSKKKPSKK